MPWKGTHEIDNSLWNSVVMHLNLLTARWASKCRRGDWVMEVIGHRAQWVQTLSPVHVRESRGAPLVGSLGFSSWVPRGAGNFWSQWGPWKCLKILEGSLCLVVERGTPQILIAGCDSVGEEPQFLRIWSRWGDFRLRVLTTFRTYSENIFLSWTVHRSASRHTV